VESHAQATPARSASPMPAGGRVQQRRPQAGHLQGIGFRIVSFVPNYGYSGLNKIDLATGPDAAELAKAIEAATASGSRCAQGDLDPLVYRPGFDAFLSENDSWR